jgi:hypothetical protein
MPAIQIWGILNFSRQSLPWASWALLDFGMKPRAVAFVVVFLMVAVVTSWIQRHDDRPRYGEPSFTIVSGSSHTPRHLRGDETISTVLAALPADVDDTSTAKPAAQSETLVLIRRGPDGMGRKLIDCDCSGHLVDPQKDQSLRDGDHLVVSPPPAPDGLQRPSTPGIPVSN